MAGVKFTGRIGLVIATAGLAIALYASSPVGARTPSPNTPTIGASTTIPVPIATSSMPANPSKTATTTLFWVGEPSDRDNGFIPNDVSYWDDHWMQHFGGVDDPKKRCGFLPCAFRPKENQFYVALPYGEYVEGSDSLKSSARGIPWFGNDALPLLKNRWVEVSYRGKTCFGQWEDVGPFENDDFSYVFGGSKPRNTYGEGAGLDISPALWDCLGMSDNGITSWRFIDGNDVPMGPWKDVVTASGISWGN